MKKILALVLVLSMVLGSFGFAFAATTAETNAGQALKNLGVLKGDAQGNLMLDTVLKRQDIIVLLSRLMGAEEEASKFPIPSAYTDIADDYYKTFIGWAQVEGLTEGIGNNKFGFDQELTVKELATFLLRALGHENAWDKAETLSVELGLVAAGANFEAKASRGVMAAATLEALKAPLAGDAKTSLGTSLGFDGFELVGELAVASIKADTAKSFQVTFKNPVEDTDAVAFSVKRGNSTVNLTTTWNSDKTVATLTNASNLAEATYVVSVTAEEEELAAETIAITPQKVAKIEFTSDKVSVLADGSKGYVTYKVLDQYNNDITSSYLANNIKFQLGVGSETAKDGLITITPNTGINLLQFTQIAITAYDTNSGTSATATLPTATTLGTLSEIKLLGIKDVDANTVTAGDTASVYYVDYVAKDMSGNETKNYDLVHAGLIFTGGGSSTDLSVSNPNVKVELVRDPADSTKAALQLKVTSTDNVVMDMPFIISAMSYSGTSTLNATLKRAAALETFTILAPIDTIASGDGPTELKYEAYDQNGNKLTKFNDIEPFINLGDNLQMVPNVDGTAKLLVTPVTATTTSVTQIINANVKANGKMTQLTLSIQKPAQPDRLVLDSSVFITAMQNGAVQTVAFDDGIKVLDQYGREIDMVDTNKPYSVKASTTTGSPFTVSNDLLLATADNEVEITATAIGTGTVTFQLYANATATGIPVDTRSTSLSVLKNDDIKGYTIDEVKNAIYASNIDAADLSLSTSERARGYAASTKVFGKTASGAKVLLAGTPIVGAFVDNASEFKVTSSATGSLKYDAVKVTAGKLPVGKTESSTLLTVSLIGADGNLHSVTTTIKSSNVAPAATTVGVDVSAFKGVSVDGDRLTVSYNSLGANFANNVSLAKFTNTGAKPANQSAITLFARDQYGKKVMQLAQFRVVSQVTNNATIGITADGTLQITGTLQVGDKATISAVATNGMIKTIEVVVGN